MKYLYLIKRGPKPEYHRAPYHPVILCNLTRIAEWEMGASDDHAWVWQATGWHRRPGGWLLVRWNGLNIDYGHIVHGFALPDGSHAAFWRDYHDWPEGIRDLLPGAVWWSDKVIPSWLQERGVVYPPDNFTQQTILDHIADDGCWMFGRVIPEYWPQLTANQTP